MQAAMGEKSPGSLETKRNSSWKEGRKGMAKRVKECNDDEPRRSCRRRREGERKKKNK